MAEIDPLGLLGKDSCRTGLHEQGEEGREERDA